MSPLGMGHVLNRSLLSKWVPWLLSLSFCSSFVSDSGPTILPSFLPDSVKCSLWGWAPGGGGLWGLAEASRANLSQQPH